MGGETTVVCVGVKGKRRVRTTSYQSDGGESEDTSHTLRREGPFSVIRKRRQVEVSITKVPIELRNFLEGKPTLQERFILPTTKYLSSMEPSTGRLVGFTTVVTNLDHV